MSPPLAAPSAPTEAKTHWLHFVLTERLCFMHPVRLFSSCLLSATPSVQSNQLTFRSPVPILTCSRLLNLTLTSHIRRRRSRSHSHSSRSMSRSNRRRNENRKGKNSKSRSREREIRSRRDREQRKPSPSPESKPHKVINFKINITEEIAQL